MAPLTAWIEQIIAEELQSIIAWKDDATSQSQGDATRFADDGSNFCSTISCRVDSSDRRLQIVEILSTKPAVLLVSDGTTSARATLSDEALAHLESEIEGSINEETTGDVFSIQEAVVISTTFGPPDGFIELRIQKLVYQYHLRKLVRGFKAIEDYAKIHHLITVKLSAIRQRQYAPAESVDGSVASQPTKKISSQPVSRVMTVVAPPQSPMGTQIASQIATQIPHPAPRRAGPTLAADGLEIEHGVNLAEPRAVDFGAAAHKPPKHRVPVAAIGTTMLLQLMGGKEDPVPPATPVIAEISSPAVPSSSPVTKRKAEDSPTLAQPASKSARIDSLPETPPRNRSQSSKEQLSTSSQQRTADKLASLLRASPSQLPASTQHGGVATGSRMISKVSKYCHFRHRIPKDQRKLLDQLSAWAYLQTDVPLQQKVPSGLLKGLQDYNVPSLQSQQTPRKSAPPASLRSVQVTSNASSKPTDAADTPGDNDDDDDDSDSCSTSSSSEESIISGWSPSQSKPAITGDMLPPDSTNENRETRESRRKGQSPSSGSLGSERSQQLDDANSFPSTPRKRVLFPDSQAGNGSSSQISQKRRVNGATGTWTEVEDIVVLDGYRQGKNATRIRCEDLKGRSESAIRNRRRTLIDLTQPQSVASSPLTSLTQTLLRADQVARPNASQNSAQKRDEGGEWIQEEDVILLDSVQKGRNAMEISIDNLSHRSPSAIRNRITKLMDPVAIQLEPITSSPSLGFGSERGHRKALDDAVENPSRARPQDRPKAALSSPPVPATSQGPSHLQRPTTAGSVTSRGQNGLVNESPITIVPALSRIAAPQEPVDSAPPNTIIKATPDRATATNPKRSQPLPDLSPPTNSQSRDPAFYHRQERSKFMKEATEQRNKRKERLETQVEPDRRTRDIPQENVSEAKTVFGEFVKAYRGLASREEDKTLRNGRLSGKGKERKRLSVLDWEL